MDKRTGIFGGSFDPVHTGHVSLAKSFLESGLIHHLLILLTPDPPHKQSEIRAGYEDRLAMLKIAFREFENVEISTLEQQLPTPSYTLQTIEYLQDLYPENLFYLCIGEDSLVNFHQWHRYLEILKRLDLIVAERPGYDSQNVSEEIMESVIMVDHHPVEASSTEIRQHVKKNGGTLLDNAHIPPAVHRYIDEKGLYRGG